MRSLKTHRTGRLGLTLIRLFPLSSNPGPGPPLKLGALPAGGYQLHLALKGPDRAALLLDLPYWLYILAYRWVISRIAVPVYKTFYFPIH